MHCVEWASNTTVTRSLVIIDCSTSPMHYEYGTIYEVLEPTGHPQFQFGPHQLESHPLCHFPSFFLISYRTAVKHLPRTIWDMCPLQDSSSSSFFPSVYARPPPIILTKQRPMVAPRTRPRVPNFFVKACRLRPARSRYRPDHAALTPALSVLYPERFA